MIHCRASVSALSYENHSFPENKDCTNEYTHIYIYICIKEIVHLPNKSIDRFIRYKIPFDVGWNRAKVFISKIFFIKTKRKLEERLSLR